MPYKPFFHISLGLNYKGGKGGKCAVVRTHEGVFGERSAKKRHWGKNSEGFLYQKNVLYWFDCKIVMKEPVKWYKWKHDTSYVLKDCDNNYIIFFFFVCLIKTMPMKIQIAIIKDFKIVIVFLNIVFIILLSYYSYSNQAKNPTPPDKCDTLIQHSRYLSSFRSSMLATLSLSPANHTSYIITLPYIVQHACSIKHLYWSLKFFRH